MVIGKDGSESERDMAAKYVRYPINARRLEWEEARVREMAGMLRKGARVLVVSCDDARHMRAFERADVAVVCVCPDEAKAARARAMSRFSTTVTADQVIKEGRGSYGGIWVCCPFEVLGENRLGVGRLAPLLSPGGILAVLALHGSCTDDCYGGHQLESDEIRQTLVGEGFSLESETEMPRDICPNRCVVQFYRRD